MSFQERIDHDLKEAMKARQTDRLATIRLLKSALKMAALEKNGETLDDLAAFAIVRREVKKRQDAAEGFDKGNRPELAAKERAEAEQLQAYLPQPLQPEEMQALVAACIAEVGATSRKEMGAVMKLASERAAGRADGKALSAAVNAALS